MHYPLLICCALLTGAPQLAQAQAPDIADLIEIRASPEVRLPAETRGYRVGETFATLLVLPRPMLFQKPVEGRLELTRPDGSTVVLHRGRLIWSPMAVAASCRRDMPFSRGPRFGELAPCTPAPALMDRMWLPTDTVRRDIEHMPFTMAGKYTVRVHVMGGAASRPLTLHVIDEDWPAPPVSALKLDQRVRRSPRVVPPIMERGEPRLSVAVDIYDVPRAPGVRVSVTDPIPAHRWQTAYKRLCHKRGAVAVERFGYRFIEALHRREYKWCWGHGSRIVTVDATRRHLDGPLLNAVVVALQQVLAGKPPKGTPISWNTRRGRRKHSRRMRSWRGKRGR